MDLPFNKSKFKENIMIRCDSEINEKVNKYLNVLMIECGLSISLDKLIKSGDHCYLETISMINNAIK